MVLRMTPSRTSSQHQRHIQHMHSTGAHTLIFLLEYAAIEDNIRSLLVPRSPCTPFLFSLIRVRRTARTRKRGGERESQKREAGNHPGTDRSREGRIRSTGSPAWSHLAALAALGDHFGKWTLPRLYNISRKFDECGIWGSSSGSSTLGSALAMHRSEKANEVCSGSLSTPIRFFSPVRASTAVATYSYMGR